MHGSADARKAGADDENVCVRFCHGAVHTAIFCAWQKILTGASG
jgi:hypothetical protein